MFYIISKYSMRFNLVIAAQWLPYEGFILTLPSLYDDDFSSFILGLLPHSWAKIGKKYWTIRRHINFKPCFYKKDNGKLPETHS